MATRHLRPCVVRVARRVLDLDRHGAHVPVR